MTSWIEKLKELDACEEAIEWARKYPSLQTAWNACECGDWMVWLVGKLSGPPGSKKRKRLILCLCDCIESSPVPSDDDNMMVIAFFLTIARDWASDGDSTLDDVTIAADVAYVAYVANVADGADVAYVANVADGADVAYVAYVADGADGADIVRKHYPSAPELDYV